jgi:hypothetical protein
MDALAREIDEQPAAHKRPGTILLVYAYRLVAALLVAGPLALLFGGAVSGYPRGDAVLFDPGGLLLVDTMRGVLPALSTVGTTAAVLFALASFLGLLPLAALIAALGEKGRVTPRFLGDRALAPIGAFTLLLGLVTVAQVLAALLIVSVTESIARRGSLGAREADEVRLIGAGVALVVVLLLGVLHDLARVAAVRCSLGPLSSLSRALAAVRRAPLRVALGWAWRAALGLVAFAVAAALGTRIGVASRAQILMSALVHQGAVLAAVFCRASWFTEALRRVDAVSTFPRESLPPAAEPAPLPQAEPPAPPSAPSAPPAPETAPETKSEGKGDADT